MNRVFCLAFCLAASWSLASGCGTGDRASRHYELYLVDAKDGEPMLLSRSFSFQPVSWSPNDRSLTYVHEEEPGRTAIHILDPTELGEDSVVQLEGAAWGLVQSLTGRVAFIQETREEAALMLMRNDGSDLLELTRARQSYQPPFTIVGWLSNGDLLVVENDGALGLLAAFDARGQRRAYDIPPVGFAPGPELSPDGTLIAWNDHCGYPGALDGIWVADVASGAARQVSKTCRVTDIAWSPTGAEIAYTALDALDDTGGLYVLDVATKATRRITNPSDGEEAGVEWRPDAAGFLLYRNLYPSCGGECPPLVPFLVAPDGSRQERVDAALAHPPDTRGALLERDYGLIFVTADTQEERTLYGAEGGWRFIALQFSPDGRWITFVRFNCGSNCEPSFP